MDALPLILFSCCRCLMDMNRWSSLQAHDKLWSTVGVNTNIISASMTALLDGLEYAIVEFGLSCSIEGGPSGARD